MSLTTVLQNHCREYIWLRVNAKAKYQQKMKTAKLLHITSYYCSNLPRPEKNSHTTHTSQQTTMTPSKAHLPVK